METLILLDEYLFSLINGTWHHPFFDTILPIWRNKLFWVPLYIYILSFVWLNFKKNVLVFMLSIIVLISVSDTISSKILKKTVQRPRPCKVEHVAQNMHQLMGCSRSFSFPSSHAFNHFSLAVFLCLTLGSFFRWIRIPLLLWAASIAYAQVYVGVHFPLDVIAGSLFGASIGYLFGRICSKKWQLEIV